MVSSKLIIRDFGPIRHIEVEFRKLTLFIGPQGSGKSTIAKLFSMFVWLEKRLLRGLLDKEELKKDSRFQYDFCGYHRLSSYFQKSTFIKFRGQAYVFIFEGGQLKISETARHNNIEVYKVMYVPSERNLLSVVDDFSAMKALPKSLLTFKEEFVMASRRFAKGFKLPINDSCFYYDKSTSTSWLRGETFRIKLADASSGFQAATPLLLVSGYLTGMVMDSNKGDKGGLNDDELEKLKKKVKIILDNKTLLPELREAALSVLSSQFKYSGFVNIVEEPEENLFPASQQRVLYELMRCCNSLDSNQLILTTHSPFMINYLTIAVKAHELMTKGVKRMDIEKIIDPDVGINIKDIAVFQLKDGEGKRLEESYGLPSDGNYLNSALEEANEMFAELEDLEFS